ncbi:hypothetical protein BJ742DRAFT_393395 [Cladochytrium replicatum]|nr:hypothetical protein BJ742DRAFT_393395 [Cladochytrium replicatum]
MIFESSAHSFEKPFQDLTSNNTKLRKLSAIRRINPDALAKRFDTEVALYNALEDAQKQLDKIEATREQTKEHKVPSDQYFLGLKTNWRKKYNYGLVHPQVEESHEHLSVNQKDGSESKLLSNFVSCTEEHINESSDSNPFSDQHDSSEAANRIPSQLHLDKSIDNAINQAKTQLWCSSETRKQTILNLSQKVSTSHAELSGSNIPDSKRKFIPAYNYTPNFEQKMDSNSRKGNAASVQLSCVKNENFAEFHPSTSQKDFESVNEAEIHLQDYWPQYNLKSVEREDGLKVSKSERSCIERHDIQPSDLLEDSYNHHLFSPKSQFSSNKHAQMLKTWRSKLHETEERLKLQLKEIDKTIQHLESQHQYSSVELSIQANCSQIEERDNNHSLEEANCSQIEEIDNNHSLEEANCSQIEEIDNNHSLEDTTIKLSTARNKTSRELGSWPVHELYKINMSEGNEQATEAYNQELDNEWKGPSRNVCTRDPARNNHPFDPTITAELNNAYSNEISDNTKFVSNAQTKESTFELLHNDTDIGVDFIFNQDCATNGTDIIRMNVSHSEESKISENHENYSLQSQGHDKIHDLADHSHSGEADQISSTMSAINFGNRYAAIITSTETELIDVDMNSQHGIFAVEFETKHDIKSIFQSGTDSEHICSDNGQFSESGNIHPVKVLVSDESPNIIAAVEQQICTYYDNAQVPDLASIPAKDISTVNRNPENILSNSTVSKKIVRYDQEAITETIESSKAGLQLSAELSNADIDTSVAQDIFEGSLSNMIIYSAECVLEHYEPICEHLVNDLLTCSIERNILYDNILTEAPNSMCVSLLDIIVDDSISVMFWNLDVDAHATVITDFIDEVTQESLKHTISSPLKTSEMFTQQAFQLLQQCILHIEAFSEDVDAVLIKEVHNAVKCWNSLEDERNLIGHWVADRIWCNLLEDTAITVQTVL